MLVQTITMDPRIARVHYSDYRKRCRVARQERLDKARKELSQIEKEDEELLAAYRSLSRGQRILNVAKVLKSAGVQAETHYPKLAITRADKEWCEFRFGQYDREVKFCGGPGTGRWDAFKPSETIQFNRDTFPLETWNTGWRRQNGLSDSHPRALVPATPAHLRPNNLGKYHILWEAEWSHRAPVDPILLKRISPHLFVVVAQWDLTPLEQQVLEGRL